MSLSKHRCQLTFVSSHYDPFYIKQEFSPSDRELIVKRQRAAYDLITPHVRLLEFLSSHFSATRHGSPHIQKVYQRLINVTLDALAKTRAHPLARECHFYVILLGLRILRASTDLDRTNLWRFKDRLLSAALAWFAFPPRYETLCTLHHQY
jgi:phosphatidylinositol 4-kinase